MKRIIKTFNQYNKLNEHIGDTKETNIDRNSDEIVSIVYLAGNGDVSFLLNAANLQDLRGVYESISNDPRMVAWLLAAYPQGSTPSFIDGEFNFNIEGGELEASGDWDILERIDYQSIPDDLKGMSL